MEEEVVLCGASSYEQKFYLNPEFETLPESIQQELQIMCVLYTEDVGGVLMVVYDEQGNLELRVDHREDDFTFDEIGSVLKIIGSTGDCVSCSFFRQSTMSGRMELLLPIGNVYWDTIVPLVFFHPRNFKQFSISRW